MKLIKRELLKSPWMGSKKKDTTPFDEPSPSFPTSFRSSSPYEDPFFNDRDSLNKRNMMSLSLPAAALAAAIQGSSRGSPDNVTPGKPGRVSVKTKSTEEENLQSIRSSLGLQPQQRKRTSSPQVFMQASYFHPPKEVTIDPNAVPPSPMRNPDMSEPTRKPLSNLINNSPSRSSMRLGDPVGDIGMRTQLWDAQRLVRVILGKSTSDEPLNTESILAAIRSFALMKQELLQLRKQQESRDGDPPAILHLPSPATTNTRSTTLYESTPQKSAYDQSDLHRKAIIESAKKITSLQEDLKQAGDSIQKIQSERDGTNETLEKVLKENEELKQKLRLNNERLERYSNQTELAALEEKDRKIAKLKCNNAKIEAGVTKATESLYGFFNLVGSIKDVSTPHDERQQLCQGFEADLQDSLSALKAVLDLVPKSSIKAGSSQNDQHTTEQSI